MDTNLKTREMKINFKDATSLVLLKDILILNKYKIFARVDNGRDITFVIEV